MTLYIVNKKAYIEISEDYLLCLGDEKEVRKLDTTQVYCLIRSILETKRAMAEDQENDVPGVEEET
jgi:hypothetical protein